MTKKANKAAVAGSLANIVDLPDDTLAEPLGQDGESERPSGIDRDLLRSGVEIRTLAIALRCYDKLQLSPGTTLSEAAKNLGLGEDTVYRQLELFEREFAAYGAGGQLFLRRPGRGRTAVAPQAEPLFVRIRALVDIYKNLTERGALRINLGASLTMGTHLLPKPTREWRDGLNDPYRAAQLILSHDMPQELLARGRRGELALVLTSLRDEDLKEWPKQDILHTIKLRMYLITPSGHRLAGQQFRSWDALRDFTVVLLDRSRRIVPDYPEDWLTRAGARTMIVQSYEEAFAMVMGGGDIVTFACPQVLNESTKLLIEAVELQPELRWQTHCVPVLRDSFPHGTLSAMGTKEEGSDEAFERWVATVRDPAGKANEGRRTFKAGKHAEASYEIAPLPDGRFAIRVEYAFRCGNCGSHRSPWTAFANRQECLAYFLEGARHHFEDSRHITSGVQEKAREKMAARLQRVFVEPKAEPPERQEATTRLERDRAETKKRVREQYPLFASLIDEEE
jgi:hypothetical protein